MLFEKKQLFSNYTRKHLKNNPNLPENSLLNEIIDRIKKKKVKDRSEKEHHMMITYYGGVREYLLSMGDFKDVNID